MTDKQLPKCYKKALDDIETICTELLKQLKCKKQECEKYKQTLTEIKPILEIYANTKVGEELLNGTSQVVIKNSGVLGSICLKFDPNPARQALQRINGEKNDLHRIFRASK